MPVAKKTAPARRSGLAVPQRAAIKVGASKRIPQQVNLSGKLYTAQCPKKGKFLQVFEADQMTKLMQLDDPDEATRTEANRYCQWMLKLLFGPEAGTEIYDRVRSDEFTEDLDEDALGEMLMHLCVIWTPDLAGNATGMKERLEPLTSKMQVLAEEISNDNSAR